MPATPPTESEPSGPADVWAMRDHAFPVTEPPSISEWVERLVTDVDTLTYRQGYDIIEWLIEQGWTAPDA